MGADIHYVLEKKTETGYESVDVQPQFLENRWYGLFGFLGDVRNYSQVEPIAARRGLPPNATAKAKRSTEDWDMHSQSWVGVEELLQHDYEVYFDDVRRPDEERKTLVTLRSFLDWNGYFEGIKYLKEIGVERIVFWFDN